MRGKANVIAPFGQEVLVAAFPPFLGGRGGGARQIWEYIIKEEVGG